MIATLEEIKAILNITGSTYDDLINSLIPVTQNNLVDLLNNYFIDKRLYVSGTFTFTNTTNVISNGSNFTDEFSAGDDIYICESINNDSVLTINTLTDTEITINSIYTLVDELESKQPDTVYIFKVNFPAGLKIPFSMMIQYGMKQMVSSSSGLKSEKIGNYSYTNGDSGGGSSGAILSYPASIIGKLRPYMRAKIV